MTFSSLRDACRRFRETLRETTGRDLVRDVSVSDPRPPADELHFEKLVSWCYVFMYEASAEVSRHIQRLLRGAAPGEHEIVRRARENVGHLRTVRAHNLSKESASDARRLALADIWMKQNGGEPCDWQKCSAALVAEVSEAIQCLQGRWSIVVGNSEDREAAIHELLLAVDREIPPHYLDRLVEDAAQEIGLKGLDVVRYRESRIDRWRELAGYFEVPDDGKRALRAAIVRELEHTFGIS